MPDNTKESFFEKVYAVVRHIPKGRVTTYGHIARFLGSAGSARMVGWAMNASHRKEPPVPAHRVVNRQGLLSGKHHFETPDMMEELLKTEGTEVLNDQVQNFRAKLWDPADYLNPEDFH